MPLGIRVPTKVPEQRELLIAESYCPECGHELDTGYDCTVCDFQGLAELPAESPAAPVADLQDYPPAMQHIAADVERKLWYLCDADTDKSAAAMAELCQMLTTLVEAGALQGKWTRPEPAGGEVRAVIAFVPDPTETKVMWLRQAATAALVATQQAVEGEESYYSCKVQPYNRADPLPVAAADSPGALALEVHIKL